MNKYLMIFLLLFTVNVYRECDRYTPTYSLTNVKVWGYSDASNKGYWFDCGKDKTVHITLGNNDRMIIEGATQ